MKPTKDRMGGVIAAEIIRVTDIQSFMVENGKVVIVLKNGIEPNFLDIVKNGVDPSIQTTASKSGILYDVNITIETKEYNCFTYTSFNKYLVALTFPTGEQHVFGTPHFPLTISSEPIYSKTPSGRTGGLYRITGKQPNNVLIM